MQALIREDLKSLGFIQKNRSNLPKTLKNYCCQEIKKIYEPENQFLQTDEYVSTDSRNTMNDDRNTLVDYIQKLQKKQNVKG